MNAGSFAIALTGPSARQPADRAVIAMEQSSPWSSAAHSHAVAASLGRLSLYLISTRAHNPADTRGCAPSARCMRTEISTQGERKMDCSKQRKTAVLALMAAMALPAAAVTPPYTATSLNPNLHRVNDAYQMMQHNTYDYGASLAGWLDAGHRAVELDVIDREDWEFNANGPYVSHDGSAGNKNCSGNPDRIGHCLNDIVGWLDTHPGQGPIFVYVDMKASWDPINAWYDSEVRLLDEKIRQILGARMYTADELYLFASGQSYAPGRPGLRQVVSAGGWPLLSSLSSRVIVAYTGGRIGATNQTHAGGIENIMAQAGRSLPYGFFCPDVESTPNQIVPGGTVDGVSNATSQFFVCSNLKARDHYQIAANAAHTHKQLMHLWDSHVYGNGDYVFNYIALAHGISAVGRDSNVTQTWGGAIPLAGVRRSLPGYFELRPTHVAGKCLHVNGASGGNGNRIDLRTCNGSINQRFVYTAEGQLRPRLSNPYCVDISGGSAGNGAYMHLWDCDGGASEKWVVGADGRFRSVSNSQQYCISVQNKGAADGTRFITYACGTSLHHQQFELAPVADWPQTTF
ncbi:MAG: hypothetical protein E6Q88_00780 [Lysobacteraceae bacterium]|nr:MAG: hypothetical protein E6Q88_00780 [Xanthomonadaceae bacterium]